MATQHSVNQNAHTCVDGVAVRKCDEDCGSQRVPTTVQTSGPVSSEAPVVLLVKQIFVAAVVGRVGTKYFVLLRWPTLEPSFIVTINLT